MGADWGIHVKTDMTTDQELQPLAVAKVFKHFMDEHQFQMAILGKQSIDDDYYGISPKIRHKHETINMYNLEL